MTVARLADSAARRLRKLAQRAALVFVRYSFGAAEELSEQESVCYVLERDQLFDRLVLQDLCVKQGWPKPQTRLADGAAAIWALRTHRGWPGRRLVPAATNRLARALAWVAANPEADIELVPVAVFWGRSPAKEHSWLKLLLAEDWVAPGRIRRFFTLLVHGRQVLVKVSKPVSLSQLLAEGLDVERSTRKAARLLRVHFRRQRAATIGPDLSHRRMLVDEVLASTGVRQAMLREVQLQHCPERRVQRRARRIAREIAAHYSHAVVRMLERVFGWLWNRLYDGIEIHNFEKLHDLAVGAEIVYVPCHRSHVDYMLLSYVIYRHGLVPPHIAAGDNLNLPIVGSVLRRGGAFFMRRSFRGDALYSAVLRSYLAAILSRGFPVKFFVEGTRSRTGRLLTPKLGLLAMTVESFLRDRRRPVIFMPVYFGYEKLVEGQTFLGELKGERKQRESLLGAVRSMRALREHFGTVDVSFGEPIRLDGLLDEVHPGWREDTIEEFFRPAWLEAAVETLGARIMTAINEAAVANAVGLTSLIVLSTPKHAIVEVELTAQLAVYLELLERAPYSSYAGITAMDPDGIVRHCEEMRWLRRRSHRLGDVLYMDDRQAVLASYYRNNIVHMFALPGLIAASLNNRSEIGRAELAPMLRRLYPCFRAELFLRFDMGDLDAEISRLVAAMRAVGILGGEGDTIRRPIEGTAAAAQFSLCSGIVEPFVEHFYLCIIYLLEHGSGTLDKTSAIERCVDAAEQLAMLYTLSSPDLFEAGLFDKLIDALIGQRLVTMEADDRLMFGESLSLVAEDLGMILRPQIRLTLQHFAVAATARPFHAAGQGGASLGRSVKLD